MQPGISTHIFLSQRLHPGLLDALHRSGAGTIELFAARHHFDYTDRTVVREIANWFRDNGTAATLHQPIFSPEQSERWSRHVSATLSLISPDKSQRIEAMDEVNGEASRLGKDIIAMEVEREVENELTTLKKKVVGDQTV